MEEKKEKGMILLSAVFFMIIMLLLGMSIASISSIGIGTSVITEEIIQRNQKTDGITNVVKSQMGMGEQWFNSMMPSSSDVLTYIFINNQTRNFSFTVPAETGLSEAYITLLRTSRNVTISSFSGGLSSSPDNETDTMVSFISSSVMTNGNYNLTINSTETTEYNVIVRVFHN